MARGFNYAPGASEEVALAGSPDLQRAQIAELSQSHNGLVREAIAARRDLSLGQMVSLAHDRSADVRAVLAANPTSPVSVLEHLAGDRHIPVLEALIGNPATPSEVVQKLAFHRKSEVRMAAARRIDGDDAAAHGTGGSGSAPQYTASAPELQDRAVGFGTGEVVDIATGLPVRHGTSLYGDPAPPTRTAPVRGFRPPSE